MKTVLLREEEFLGTFKTNLLNVISAFNSFLQLPMAK